MLTEHYVLSLLETDQSSCTYTIFGRAQQHYIYVPGEFVYVTNIKTNIPQNHQHIKMFLIIIAFAHHPIVITLVCTW